MDTKPEIEQVIEPGRLEEINVGDEMIVLTKKGREGSVIGRLNDGRVILFSKETPFEIAVGDTVLGKVAFASPTYVIVDPERVMGDTDEALVANLRNVSISGHYQHAVIARGVLRLLEESLE